MSDLHFSWNTGKADLNKQKHRVTFEEARGVFYDEKAVLIHDPDHSDEEDRFILFGMSRSGKLLVISHSYREGEKVIRIISARKATKREAYQYGKA